MAEVYCNQFVRNLVANYTAGSGILQVNSAAPVAVQTGTFRVRLGNAANTILIVTNAGTGTTWNVTAEANDSFCASGLSSVYGPEITAGMFSAFGLHLIRDLVERVGKLERAV